MSAKSEAYAAYLKDIYGEYDARAEAVASSNQIVLAARKGEFAGLGSMPEGDIMALAFIVMMEAAKSAREDLKAILEEMKAANQAKQRMRETLRRLKAGLEEASDEPEGDSSNQSGGEGGGLSIDPCAVLDTDLAVEMLIRVAAKQSDDEAQTLADETILWRERRRRAKKRGAAREDLDSLSEISELSQLRLQMMLDRRSKLLEMLSNILKKMSETQSAIVENLK